MKKKIIFACMLLVFACMLCMGVMAQEATYYLYDDGTALPEGDNNISVSELYQQSETEAGLFANLKDGDNIVIELQESISYTPTYGTMNNVPNQSNCLKISAAATVTVKFNGYSWWFTRDDAYDAFVVYNENATLNLIGTKAKNPDGTIKELGTNYKGSEINENIDVYSDFVIVYLAGGKLHCENLAAYCTEETIYQKDGFLSGKAEAEFIDCSMLTNAAGMYTIGLAGKANSNNNLRIDGGLYGSICAHNILDNSYIKNATVKQTATWFANALIFDSWKGRNAYNFPVENSTIDGRYCSDGDSNIIVGKNSSFGTFYLGGDSSGGAYVELIDSTYTSVDFAGKDGQLTVMTSPTCEMAGAKTVYNKDGSTNDAEYATLNPAKGHTIADATDVLYENYSAKGYYIGVCSACGEEGAEKVASAPMLVENLGYSCIKESNLKYAVTQGYKINKEMLKYVSEDFEYGMVVYVNTTDSEIAPKDLDDALAVEFTTNYDTFKMKLFGVPEDCADLNLIFCAYVVENGEVFYLDNGTTSKSLVGQSINDLKEILGE